MTLLNILLEITIYSVVLFGAIWLFRILLKKQLSPVMLYAMWFILIARLLMPVTITSGFSFITIPPVDQPAAYSESVDLTDMFDNTAEPAGSVPYNDGQTTHKQEALSQQSGQNTSVQSDTISSSNSKLNITWQMALITLWLVGIAIMLIQIGISVLKLRKRIKSAQTVPSQWQHIADELQTELGFKRSVRIVMIEGFPSPALCGGIKPVIVLPSEMAGKSEESIRFALLHEMTHIKRNDHIVSMLLLLLRAVYWFNPVVWLMMKQMRLDIETACDSCLTKPMTTSTKKRYAGTMLSMYAQQQIRYVLGMSLGQTKKMAERRLRCMFMRSRSSWNGKMVAILLTAVLLVTCFTTACQPTPEKPIVVGKDQDKMLEQLVQTPNAAGEEAPPAFSIADMQVPENYTFSTTGADGKLTVSVDAPVRLPDADILPTAKVVPGRFTQEMVSAMLDYLFGDTPYYQRDNRLTKAQLERIILDKQKRIADGVFDDHPDRLEDVQQQIAHWQEQLETAPEKRDEPKLSDGTMIKDEVWGSYSIDVQTYDEVIGYIKGYFNCYSVPQTKSSGDLYMGHDYSHLHYSDYSSEDDDYYNYTMDGAQLVYSDTDIPDDLKAKLGVTLDEAKQQVEGFLDAGEIKDMMCTAAFVIDDHGTGHVDDYSGVASDFAFKLFYTRSVNGVPVMPTSEFCQNSREDYDYPWVYESLEVIVTDGGIVDISWKSPCDVSEIIADNTEIIDFEEAAEIFEAKMKIFYEARLDTYGFDSIDIDIDSINLGLLRIKQQNSGQQVAGLYVPVWVFYGTVKQTLTYSDGYTHVGYDHGCDFPDKPYIVLAINAINGSIIDVEVGY